MRVVGGGGALRRCLGRLASQADPQRVEVLVPVDATVAGVADLQREFPWARVVDMGVIHTDARPDAWGAAHELYDRRTARGLAEARGDIVALVEDYGAPAVDWCEQVIAAHERLTHGVIGGAVEHAGGSALNWAVYFLDFGRYQLPLAEYSAEYVTDVNVSYKRAALERVRELWTDRYNEVTVHWALAAGGVSLWLTPRLVVCEARGRLGVRAQLRERLTWGRLFGASRARASSPVRRAIYALSSPALPFVLTGRIIGHVWQKRRNRRHLVRCLPHLLLVAAAWCTGECLGYVTAREYR